MFGRAVVVLAPDIVRACKESSSGMKSEPNVGFACELVSVAVWPLRWPLCVAEETLGGAENGKETCRLEGAGVTDAVTESLLDLWWTGESFRC
jgi:hypothetical protein